MGVMLVLGPGKARELESRINILDGGKIEIATNPIGGRRITMPRVDSRGHGQVYRGASKLDQVSNTPIQEAIFIELTPAGCGEARKRIGTDDKPVSFAVQVVPQI